MLKIYGAFFFTLLTLHVRGEILEERFKTYHMVDATSLKSINGGPVRVYTKINGHDVAIYSPEINFEALNIKPRPRKIAEAIVHPDQFFKKDAEDVINKFEEFAKEFRDCAISKRYSQAQCMKEINICFGAEKYSVTCGGWSDFEMFRLCAPEKKGSAGLANCLKNNRDAFNLFAKCFEKNNERALMFNVYGADAKRRDYYTIDTLEPMNDFSCRFTVMDNRYHLISINKISLYRPDLTVIPLKLFVEHNHSQLLQSQRETKKREKEESQADR